MSLPAGKKRFESEVHVGLLSIILLLLLLNVGANYVIHSAYQAQRAAVTDRLQHAARTITSDLEERGSSALDLDRAAAFRRRFGLSNAILITADAPIDHGKDKLPWFISALDRLPPEQIPTVSRIILGAEYEALTPGEDDQFFYAKPVLTGEVDYLLILSTGGPELAFLESARRLLLLLGVVALGLAAVLYLYLSRFIVLPFRMLRQEALSAGRKIGGRDDVESMVRDYELLIKELQQKERQLIELNEQVTNKADRLEKFTDYLLRSMSSGLVTVDRAGTVMSSNTAASEILGVESGKAVSLQFRNLFRSEQVCTDIDEAIASGESAEYRELQLIAADGSTRTCGVGVSVVLDNNRQPMGASILLNDLTETVSLRAELEARSRLAALGEMAGGLAHQLRNSLAAVAGYGTLLRRRMQKQILSPEIADAMLEEIRQAEELIERLLSFVRPLHLSVDQCLLHNLIKEVVDGIQARPDFRDVEFSVACPDQLVIRADKLLLKQAILNIVENAACACMSTKGKVIVEGLSDCTRARISVSDNGVGMSDEVRANMFTPFFSSRPSGTGLGLPLAAKIIDMHGGSIHAESIVGKGSRFTIYLPTTHELADGNDGPARVRANVAN